MEETNSVEPTIKKSSSGSDFDLFASSEDEEKMTAPKPALAKVAAGPHNNTPTHKEVLVYPLLKSM